MGTAPPSSAEPHRSAGPLGITPRLHPAGTSAGGARQCLSEHKCYGRAAEVLWVLEKLLGLILALKISEVCWAKS